MPFISSVTRRKEDAGVTLRAKVVTPKHHLSATKQYKIKIKANAMSDYDCCVADNALVVAKINNRNDLENITQALEGMDLYGNNDTSHTYSLENTFESAGRITDYLANDGQVISRPLYGTESSIDGFLVVKTSKNAESVTSKIPISMAPYSITEVFANSNLYNVSILWNTIRGENDSASLNGMNNVHKDLDLSKKIDLSSVCTSDGLSAITCTYDIKDYLAEDSAYPTVDTNRISNLGVVSRMTYENAAQLFLSTYASRQSYDNTPTQSKWIDKIEGSYEGTSIVGDALINKMQRIPKGARIAFRVGRISVKAHFRAEGMDFYSQELPLQIVSEYLTCDQVKNAIINSCKVHFYSNMNSINTETALYTLEQKSLTDALTTLNTIQAQPISASGDVIKGMLSVYLQQSTDNAIINDTLRNLALSSTNDPTGFGGLNGLTMDIFIKKINPLSDAYDFSGSNVNKLENNLGTSLETGGVVPQNQITSYVIVNYQKFIEETDPDKNKFAILGQLRIAGGIYSATGQNIGDSSMTETINLATGFQIVAS